MELLTKELEKKFEEFPLGSQDGKYGLAKVIVKYFNPCGVGTWLITEGEKTDDGDFEMFGYCHLGDDENAELGYVRLSELQAIKGPLGIGIERDLYFEEDCTLENAIYKQGFKVPDFLDTEERIREILLSNGELLEDVVREINLYNGALSNIDFIRLDEEELAVYFGNDLLKFAKAIQDGDFDVTDDYFTIDDVFGHVTSYTLNEMIEEYKNNIDDIVRELFALYEVHLCKFNYSDYQSDINDILDEYFSNLHPYAK